MLDQFQMPVCQFFLRGKCSNDNCPYSHVNVSKKAEVCEDFLKGFCSRGQQVSLWLIFSSQLSFGSLRSVTLPLGEVHTYMLRDNSIKDGKEEKGTSKSKSLGINYFETLKWR